MLRPSSTKHTADTQGNTEQSNTEQWKKSLTKSVSRARLLNAYVSKPMPGDAEQVMNRNDNSKQKLRLPVPDTKPLSRSPLMRPDSDQRTASVRDDSDVQNVESSQTVKIRKKDVALKNVSDYKRSSGDQAEWGQKWFDNKSLISQRENKASLKEKYQKSLSAQVQNKGIKEQDKKKSSEAQKQFEKRLQEEVLKAAKKLNKAGFKDDQSTAQMSSKAVKSVSKAYALDELSRLDQAQQSAQVSSKAQQEKEKNKTAQRLDKLNESIANTKKDVQQEKEQRARKADALQKMLEREKQTHTKTLKQARSQYDRDASSAAQHRNETIQGVGLPKKDATKKMAKKPVDSQTIAQSEGFKMLNALTGSTSVNEKKSSLRKNTGQQDSSDGGSVGSQVNTAFLDSTTRGSTQGRQVIVQTSASGETSQVATQSEGAQIKNDSETSLLGNKKLLSLTSTANSPQKSSGVKPQGSALENLNSAEREQLMTDMLEGLSESLAQQARMHGVKLS